jgi:hypothetical protein
MSELQARCEKRGGKLTWNKATPLTSPIKESFPQKKNSHRSAWQQSDLNSYRCVAFKRGRMVKQLHSFVGRNSSKIRRTWSFDSRRGCDAAFRFADGGAGRVSDADGRGVSLSILGHPPW